MFVEIAQPIAVYVTTIFLLVVFGRYRQLTPSSAIVLYLWSTLTCFIIIYVISLSGGDEPVYYASSINDITFQGQPLSFDFGTNFIIIFAQLFSKYFSLTYISTFVVFNFIGSIGYIIFADTLLVAAHPANPRTRAMIWAMIWMPSIGIWTSSIGKDCFSFLAIALFIRATLNGTDRPLLAGTSVLLMLLVRPHIALALIIGWTTLYFVRSRITPSSIMLFGALIFLTITFVLPVVLQKVGLEDFSGESLNYLVEFHGKQAFRRDDAAFWYSQALPTRLLMTAFYPTVLSASGLLQLVVAVENLFLSYLFIRLIFQSRFPFNIRKEDLHFWVYMLVSWGVLGAIMYNSGLAARQKWMFIPILLVLVVRYTKR